MALCRRILIYPLDDGYLVEEQGTDEQGNFQPTKHIGTNSITFTLEHIKTYLQALTAREKITLINDKGHKVQVPKEALRQVSLQPVDDEPA